MPFDVRDAGALGAIEPFVMGHSQRGNDLTVIAKNRARHICRTTDAAAGLGDRTIASGLIDLPQQLRGVNLQLAMNSDLRRKHAGTLGVVPKSQ